MYWMKVVSWRLGVLSFMLLLADIIGIWRAVAAYRAVILIAQAVMSSLLLPDPRKDWIEPAIATELGALCALERERASGAKALDPTTDQAIVGTTLFCRRSGKLANPCRIAPRIADLRFSIAASMPSTKPNLFREMSLIRSWGRIGTTARPWCRPSMAVRRQSKRSDG